MPLEKDKYNNVKIIDFLINLSFDRELISNKKYLRLGTKLEEMIRYNRMAKEIYKF